MQTQLTIFSWISPKATLCAGALGVGLAMMVGCSSTGNKGKSLVSGLPSPKATLASAETSAKPAATKSGSLFGSKTAKKDTNSKAVQELISQGRAYEARNKADKAAKAYEDALSMDPNNIVALHRLGVIADSQGATEEAEVLLTKALKQQPKNAEICADLGYCYFLQQRYTEAESLSRQAILHDSKNPLYRNNLGLILGHQERYDEAFEEFSKAGTKADAYYNMAFVFTMQDHVDEAKECFREALALKPDHKGAREALANFERSETMSESDERALVSNSRDNRNWVPYVEPGAESNAGSVAVAGATGSEAGSVKQASAEVAMPKTSEISRFTRALHNRGSGTMNHHMASQRGDARSNPNATAPQGNLMPVSAK